MQRQQSLKGSWPLASCPVDCNFQIAMCKLEILKACRHHIEHLSCRLPEESLCSLPTDVSLSFPGPFVKIQVAVALRSNKQALFDCRLEANRSGQFKVNGGHVIEAEVKPAGCMHLAETTAIDCSGNELPSCSGKFSFLLPASIPTAYHINLKFRAAADLYNRGAGELLDEIKLCILTHYEQTNLFDYWDGHSLSTVELPFPKKQLVGILGTPEAQQIVSYFQGLVENGANECFRQDQLRLTQHTCTSSRSEALYKDLLLAVKLEECLLLYQMGDLEGCKQVGKDVCIEANSINSPNFNALAGRAKNVVSGAYKMEKDFTKAEELLDSATELLEAVVPGEETSINRTCLAALLSEKSAVIGITKLEKKKFKKATKDALLHYRHQLDKNQNRNARGPRRTLTRAIFFYLHATRDKATNLQIAVSKKDLASVEKFVQQFRRGFLPGCPLRDKALFYGAHGDLLTRKGQYEEAVSLLSEGLRIAEDLQLQADIQGSRDRLQQLNRLRMERGETRRMPREMAEERMGRYQGFQEPGHEVLERYLTELTRMLRCRLH